MVSRRPRAGVALHFECIDETAQAIFDECTRLQLRGTQGRYPYDCNPKSADRKIFERVTQRPAFGGLDKGDLATLFRDAWIDGIERKDRCTVNLDSQACDACCGVCGQSLTNGAEACKHCGCTDIGHQVMVTVDDPFAEEWADGDKYIDGSTWESVGNGEIYTILFNRSSLVDDLRADGYALDLSAYESE